MKKSIALVLTLLLATALMLTACNQAETTDNAVRWVDGEVLTYNITLADYTAKDSSALFGNFAAFHDVAFVVGYLYLLFGCYRPIELVCVKRVLDRVRAGR